MAAAPPEIDVVVVTWQGRDLLRSCLQHLRAQTVPHRVIVADNASTDGTAELVAGEFPEVRLVQLPENLGFGAGNNRGVAAGSAPYVVLVNNDVDADPRFLEELVAPLRADAGVGAVAGLTTQPGNGLVDQIGVQLDRGLCAYSRGRGQDPDALRLGPLGAPCAGAAAYRRSAYEQVGGFDETLFAYSEDLDLGLRLHDAGWRFAEAPHARGVHLGGASTGSGSPFQRRLGAFGRGFTLGRYRPAGPRGLLHAFVVDLAVIVWGLLRHRTAVPLTARAAGLRAATGRRCRPVAPELIDREVGLREALRRLAAF